MSTTDRRVNRYWGDKPLPKTKDEFFNAVTTPAPAGTGSLATIRLYGPIDSWGGYWGISTKDVGAVLDALPDTVTQIILRLNSPGGEVFEGISILNMLCAHKASVTAVVDGLAASAASVIAAGCDDTVMSPGTQMMIHSPWNIAIGNSTELRKTADVLDGIESSLIEIYTAKAGEKDWATLLADETWLNAAESVAMGLANRVAVIPDAGETETVGDDEPEIIPLEGDNDEADDAAARFTLSIFARKDRPSHKPPASEPVDTNRKETVAMSDILQAGLRERLGVSDAAASDETLLTALDEVLAEQTSEPTAPAGTVLIDATVLAELQSSAAAGLEAREQQAAERRDRIVDSAMREGRITPASRATWREQLDSNEEGTTALLNSLPKNTVPVVPLGHADEPSTEDSLYASAWSDDDEKEA